MVASCSLVLVFAAAGTPIPLFTTYRTQDGITNGDLALAAVTYFAAAATALLTLGRLSDHLGRRPTAVAALASSAAGCLLLTTVDGVGPLLAGRVLQGLACGIASSGLGSYIVDSAPTKPRWLPAVITGSSPMTGITLGALGSGALVQYGPAPRVLVYLVVSVALVACAAIMALSAETVARRPGALASLRPRLLVPTGSGRLLLATGASIVATWSLGGFYQAFGPSMAVEGLGTTNALVAAAVFTSVMILTPLGGPLSARLAPTVALRVGMVALLPVLAGIVITLHTGAVVPFILVSMATGLAQGCATTGGIRGLLAAAQPSERAGLLSTIYLISYCGAALPGLLAGQLTTTFDLLEIAAGITALSALAAVVTLTTTPTHPGARRRQAPAGQDPR